MNLLGVCQYKRPTNKSSYNNLTSIASFIKDNENAIKNRSTQKNDNKDEAFDGSTEDDFGRKNIKKKYDSF